MIVIGVGGFNSISNKRSRIDSRTSSNARSLKYPVSNDTYTEHTNSFKHEWLQLPINVSKSLLAY